MRAPTSDQVLAGLVAAMALVALSWRAAPREDRAPPQARAATPVEITAENPLDLNATNATDIERLPGIGPALADRILKERARQGRFARVEDLTKVRGIGAKTLMRIRRLVTVGGSPEN